MKEQIPEFSKSEIEELQFPLRNELRYYKEVEEKRRNILGKFRYILKITGNKKFLNRVLPRLFTSLHEVLKETLQCILVNNDEITAEAWVEGWGYEETYHSLENELSQDYYALEALILEFENMYVSPQKRPYFTHYSEVQFRGMTKAMRSQIMEVLHEFHHESIKKCKKKARKWFLEELQRKFKGVECPLVTYADALIHDLDLNVDYSIKKKLHDVLRPPNISCEFHLGMEPIWKDWDLGLKVYYFDHSGEPFVLFSNSHITSMQEVFKIAGEESLLRDWFNDANVKEKIVSHIFFSTYYHYSQKDTLTRTDIEQAKRQLINALHELEDHFGLTYDIAEAAHLFHLRYKKDAEEEYDPDVKACKLQLLADLFPLKETDDQEGEDEPVEIVVLDLETTGRYTSDMIIEVAAVKVNLETGQIDILMNTICQEHGKDLKHEAWIFNHSSLKIHQVWSAPELKEFRKELQHILNSYPVTSYNQSFDFSFLTSRGFKIRKRFWDPMLKFTDLVAIPYNDWEYKYPKVAESWYHFFPEVTYMGNHRALGDAIIEAVMIREYYRQEKIIEEEDND